MPPKLLAMIALFLLPLACHAEVLEISSGGFSVRHTVDTHATLADSWVVMTNHIDEWWNPEHSWSGDAKNLYIDAKVGGCFCEHLQQGGGVEHLRIVFLNPGREIRFDGSLGPLQTMAVQGRMVWQIDAGETGSSITFRYRVHGSLEGGFEGIAPAVDSVIGEQLERLGKRLENR